MCPKDEKSDFETLLKNDTVVTIHVENLHYLVIEIYKVKNDISPDVIRDIFHFQENENYNFRSGTHLASRNMRTNCLGKKWYQTQEPKYVRCCQRNLKMLHLCKLLKVN